MKSFTDVDKNFVIETHIKRNNLKLYDIEEAPFSVYGFMRENGKFSRMPEEVAKRVNEGVLLMNTKNAVWRLWRRPTEMRLLSVIKMFTL